MTEPKNYNPTMLNVALHNAKEAVGEWLKTHPWQQQLPCGFAWLYISVRKNAAIANVLKEHGFRWSDYNKQYQLGAYEWTNTQDMDYKFALLRVMRASLHDAGFSAFGVTTRID